MNISSQGRKLYFIHLLEDSGFGSATSLVVPLRGSTEEFVVSVNTVLTLVNWTAADADHVLKQPTELSSVETRRHNRFNDGKADPQGRLWAGRYCQK